jgi:hypothetical protein
MIEIMDFMGQVAAIARSKSGRGQIRAVVYEDGKRDVRAVVVFNADSAIQATKELEAHKKELDAVLRLFTALSVTP